MKLMIEIDEARFKDIQRIAEVQLESNHFQTAEQIIASGSDVLDKIRAEIETKYGQCDICEYFENYDYEENDISEYRPIGNIADILQIIDRYKVERSDKG